MPTTLQLLHASDYEAGISALDDAVRFSAVLNRLKTNTDPATFGVSQTVLSNTVTISSGDNSIPGPFLFASSDPSLNGIGGLGTSSSPLIGRADVAILNELGIQASTIGNHDLDLGVRQFGDALRSGSGNPGANFPYVSSNINFAPEITAGNLRSTDLATNQNTAEASTIKSKLAKSTVITIAGTDGILGNSDDQKIGVVGATTPLLPQITSAGQLGVVPTNPVDYAALAAEIQKSVDALTATGINKIILTTHMQQINVERDELAPRLKDVDIIIAGGSNTLLADSTDPLRTGDVKDGDYPIVKTSAIGQPTLVVNTDGNYRYVGRLVLEFDDNGVINSNSLNPAINGAYAADEAGVDRVYGSDVNPREKANANIVAITDGLRKVISAKDNLITGNTEFFLNGDRNFTRTEETNLGNLTADANIAYTRQIDPTVVLSLKNGGGIRDNIGEVAAGNGATNSNDIQKLPPQPNPLAPNKKVGDVTQLGIENSLRFNNSLSLITVTASQLKELLENGVSGVKAGATPGAFPQVGGMRFSFDATKTAQVLAADGTVTTPGTRIQSLVIVNDKGRIIDTVVQNGALVGDANRNYRMVTLNFLAGSTTTSGGDGYPFARFVRENPTLANRIDLTGETNVDLNGNGKIDSAVTLPAGKFTFAATGSEQDALAEYLAEIGQFSVQDTPAAEDIRIQNLAARSDTVVQGGRLFEGSKAKDNLTGTTGDDTLSGFGGADQLKGRAGSDEVEGGLGADTLLGDNGDDLLSGGKGNDQMRGAADSDTLLGGLGSDTATGGNGNDQFVLEKGAGVDLIKDFGSKKGNRDLLGLADGLTFKGLTITDVQGGALISSGQDELALLSGVTANSLKQGRFVTFELASL